MPKRLLSTTAALILLSATVSLAYDNTNGYATQSSTTRNLAEDIMRYEQSLQGNVHATQQAPAIYGNAPAPQQVPAQPVTVPNYTATTPQPYGQPQQPQIQPYQQQQPYHQQPLNPYPQAATPQAPASENLTPLPDNVGVRIQPPSAQDNQPNSSGINFLSGGVGFESQNMMKEQKPNYNTYLLFTDARSGAFLSSVEVEVRNATGEILLQRTTEGPYAYLNLPKGSYIIRGTYNGVVKTQKVNISNERSGKQYSFAWDVGVRD